MRNLNSTLYSGDAASAVDSSYVKAEQMNRVSIQAIFSTTSLAGNLKLQVSNDPTVTPTNWSTLSTTAVAAGALTLIPTVETSYQWVRVRWEPSAGTGNVTININTQGLR